MHRDLCYMKRIFVAVLILGCCSADVAKAQVDASIRRHLTPRRRVSILVDPGNKGDADDYYNNIVSNAVGFSLLNGSNEPIVNLDRFLQFAGYKDATDSGLTADRIERFGPATLMDLQALRTAVQDDGGNPANVPQLADGDILSTRWFAPKITDTTLLQHPPEYHQYGWRKLVRLRTLAGSDAEGKKVTSIHILFNVFASREQLLDTAPEATPFNVKQRSGYGPNRSVNNQMMLVLGPDAPGFANDPVLWLVFGKTSRNSASSGKLGFALNASFDYRHPSTAPPGSKYFVPESCSQCHGGRSIGKLNYLDTDHWFDRVAADDDFPFILTTRHGVLLDGGQDQSSAQFRDAFEVVRKLNAEIKLQNELKDAAGLTFQVRSVRNWVRLHQAFDGHVGILEDTDADGFLDRSITGTPSISANPNDRWRKNDRIDESLFPLLNRFCYRCHSSLAYTVYDRSAVVERSRSTDPVLQEFVSNPNRLVPFMPQDRVLAAVDRDRIVDLANRLVEVQPTTLLSTTFDPDVIIEIIGRGRRAKYIEQGMSEQEDVHVTVGESVRWDNRSNIGHTATSDAVVSNRRLFDTGRIPRGGQSELVVFDRDLFEAAGGKPGGSVDITYFCVPHPTTMKSTIVLSDK